MAIVSSIAVGKARKSAGNVTFTTSKGRVIMKEKALNVRNPRTAGQVSQRSKMSRTVLAYQTVGNKCANGITRLSRYGSRYNQFVKANIDKIDDIFPAEQIVADCSFDGLMVANGALPEVECTATYGLNAVDFTPKTNNVQFDKLKVGDKLHAVLKSTVSNTVYMKSVALTQSNISGKTLPTITLATEAFDNDIVGIAMYIVSADGTVSSTAYITEATV